MEIVGADLTDPRHRDGIVAVLDSYARDPMGGGTPLSPDVRARVADGLRDHPTALVLLALDAGRTVGVAVCFFGYSTFAARPLLNVHDLAVLPSLRGKGVGRALLAAAEARAREAGCCRLTLEVLDGNGPARGLYESFGFRDVAVGEKGPTRFLAKPLEPVRPPGEA